MASKDIINDPWKRCEWVKYQLRLRSTSFAQIARNLQINRWSVRQALFLPSARCEAALAAALEMPVQDLFPERYTPNGERLHHTRCINSRKRTAEKTHPSVELVA